MALANDYVKRTLVERVEALERFVNHLTKATSRVRTEIVDESFGPFIRDTREKRKLSVRQLADHLGVTHGTISRIENNKKNPSLRLYKQLAEWLDKEKR